MLKLLGILDFISASLFIFLRLDILDFLGFIFGAYLIIKGLIFFDWYGLFDLLSGVLLILAGLGSFSFLSYLAALWLAQKALLSLIS